MSFPRTLNAWAAPKKGAQLTLQSFPLRDLDSHEVLIRVQACGVCHSDIHLINDDWGISKFPLVPGHEIFGTVVARSRDAVLKEGAFVGVGWQRSACFECHDCINANDNLCEVNRLTTCADHFGGYADYHITDSRYAFEIPTALAEPKNAPLMCGGATVFTPLCEFMNPREKAARVGIVGFGGLGHIAVKLAVAMGYSVTAFSSSKSKGDEAVSMGADSVVNSTSAESIESVGRKLDLVIVTANVDLPWPSFLKTLRSDGTLCFVGIPPSDLTFGLSEILGKRLRVAASPIASRSRIRQMLEFCAAKGVVPQSELFAMTQVNEVLGRVKENRTRYRAVLTA